MAFEEEVKYLFYVSIDLAAFSVLCVCLSTTTVVGKFSQRVCQTLRVYLCPEPITSADDEANYNDDPSAMFCRFCCVGFFDEGVAGGVFTEPLQEFQQVEEPSPRGGHR